MCLEMWLEWRDISRSVSMEVMQGVVEWDMEELVAATVELVESMDWTKCSAEVGSSKP